MADTKNPTTNAQTTGSSALISRGSDGFRNGNSNYTFEQFTYPTDLFEQTQATNSNNPNVAIANTYSSYVVFFINVTEESRVSKLGKEIIVGEVDKADQNTLQKGGNANINAFGEIAGEAAALTAAALAAPLAAGRAGSALFSKGGVVSRIGKATGKFASTVGAAAAAGGAVGYLQSGVAVEALAAMGVKATSKINRLKTAIAMNVPNNYVVGYRVNYADEELGTLFGNAAAAARGETGVNAAQVAGMGLAGKSQGMPAISALTKAAINPRKEQLFRSVDNRRFTFEYQFAPRSQKEAANIKRIINTFKYHMHPEYLDNETRLAYLFPSEFDIVHMFNNKESEHMHKISTCVLAEMTVNYSPNGQFSTHTDGFPTQINVQMTFVELETLTKERFMNESDLVNGSDKAVF